MDVNESIYIEGKSPKPHEWEPAQPWLDRYDHPLWKRFGAHAKGAGHGGMDFFVIHALIEALTAADPMLHARSSGVAWESLTPLCHQYIAAKQPTPDFHSVPAR